MKKNKGIKHPGLVEDAQKLQVSYQHLFKVLTGERQSKSLLRRYRELKKSQGKPVNIKPAPVADDLPTPSRHGNAIKLSDIGPLHRALAINVLIRCRQASQVERLLNVPDDQMPPGLCIPRNELISLALVGAAALNVDFKNLNASMLFTGSEE